MKSVITVRKRINLVVAGLCMAAIFTGCSNSSGIYKPGTYTASGAGYAGDVVVEVEFDKDSILSVIVTDENETEEIGGRVIDELQKKVVEEQTFEVDAVSSATITSEAIKEAVKSCMEQAKR